MGKKPIPRFANEKEEAEFWAKHSPLDFDLEVVKNDVKLVETEKRRIFRRHIHECSKCYVHGRISGQMISQFVCSGCGLQKPYPNTSTPLHCDDCCEKNNICGRCGKEMD
jgi:hypothetical protein